MTRTYLQRVPEPLYKYIKDKSRNNGTKATHELSNMFNKYKEMESTLNRLEGNNVLVIKKKWGFFR